VVVQPEHERTEHRSEQQNSPGPIKFQEHEACDNWCDDDDRDDEG